MPARECCLPSREDWADCSTSFRPLLVTHGVSTTLDGLGGCFLQAGPPLPRWTVSNCESRHISPLTTYSFQLRTSLVALPVRPAARRSIGCALRQRLALEWGLWKRTGRLLDPSIFSVLHLGAGVGQSVSSQCVIFPLVARQGPCCAATCSIVN